MESTSSHPGNTPGNDYVKSLRDPVKRRYASEYLAWLRAGRVASSPARGALSPTVWKVICANLDALG
jgi:hypothetical protein